MWKFSNPVNIAFGNNQFSNIAEFIKGRTYTVVTYGQTPFIAFTNRLKDLAGAPKLILNDVSPNPSFLDLIEPSDRIKKNPPEVIVALGGGSVIDTAKVLALATSGFGPIKQFLQTKNSKTPIPNRAIPIIAIPTTAGTGSEVTKWATVWDTENNQKYSLSREDLYPTHAIIDPELMLTLPRDQTISTGLDALSHALESIWNVNANPISTTYAIGASKRILSHLQLLSSNLEDLHYRTVVAEAALYAGLAFSNTRTALAHSLSYPITLHHGVSHGIACSFTLPAIMRSVIGEDTITDNSLREIFGDNLEAGAVELEKFMNLLDVPLKPGEYGVDPVNWNSWISNALKGERGLNFIGEKNKATRILNQIVTG